MLLQRAARLRHLSTARRIAVEARSYRQPAGGTWRGGGEAANAAACCCRLLLCGAAARPTAAGGGWRHAAPASLSGLRCGGGRGAPVSTAAAAAAAPDAAANGVTGSAAQGPDGDAFEFKFTAELPDLGGKPKARLDAFLSARLPDASRAKIQASIRAGLVAVNGSPVNKASAAVRAGDEVTGSLLPPEPCTAEPEAIPLDIVFEDDYVIVVNKAPGMVVHLSPGHSRGTLVNALLGHCGLPAMSVPSGSARAGGGGLLASEDDLLSDGDDDGDEEGQEGPRVQGHASSSGFSGSAPPGAAAPLPGAAAAAAAGSAPPKGVLRPGIVHRLDKGTSGLMVVAKDDLSHARLCEQFKARTVSRIYHSVTLGCPSPPAGRVATNIARDPNDRLRMAALGYGAARGRTAASNYRTLRRLGGGGAALVEWRLETGRTHQIRVHAKHLGHPLLGDDTYGSGNASSARALAGRRASAAPAARAALDAFGRPALHALTLGFDHPRTGARLNFESRLPEDMEALLAALEGLQLAPDGGGGGGGRWPER